jgi:hypothetical protein
MYQASSYFVCGLRFAVCGLWFAFVCRLILFDKEPGSEFKNQFFPREGVLN